MPLLREELYYDPAAGGPRSKTPRSSIYDTGSIGGEQDGRISRDRPGISTAVNRYDPAYTNLNILNTLSSQKFGSKGGIHGRSPLGRSQNPRDISADFALQDPRSTSVNGQRAPSNLSYNPLKTVRPPVSAPDGPGADLGGVATGGVDTSPLGGAMSGAVGSNLSGMAFGSGLTTGLTGLSMSAPAGMIAPAVAQSAVMSALSPLTLANSVIGTTIAGQGALSAGLGAQSETGLTDEAVQAIAVNAFNESPQTLTGILGSELGKLTGLNLGTTMGQAQSQELANMATLGPASAVSGFGEAASEGGLAAAIGQAGGETGVIGPAEAASHGIAVSPAAQALTTMGLQSQIEAMTPGLEATSGPQAIGSAAAAAGHGGLVSGLFASGVQAAQGDAVGGNQGGSGATGSIGQGATGQGVSAGLAGNVGLAGFGDGGGGGVK